MMGMQGQIPPRIEQAKEVWPTVNTSHPRWVDAEGDRQDRIFSKIGYLFILTMIAVVIWQILCKAGINV